MPIAAMARNRNRTSRLIKRSYRPKENNEKVKIAGGGGGD